MTTALAALSFSLPSSWLPSVGHVCLCLQDDAPVPLCTQNIFSKNYPKTRCFPACLTAASVLRLLTENCAEFLTIKASCVKSLTRRACVAWQHWRANCESPRMWKQFSSVESNVSSHQRIRGWSFNHCSITTLAEDRKEGCLRRYRNSPKTCF